MNTFKKFLPVFVLLFVAVEAKADGAFQSLSFADAVAKAKKENKFVFVDFFTTWCGPCKMMDRQTFPDAKVSTWLKKKAIAVKYDAEREVALAERFNVQFYPTLIFLKPDGTEFDRISGFVPPDEFMKVARGLEKGESSLDRMRKEVA
ncbi:MAG: thioredoxin family protein, partial [Planctomycetes bacterium]|nr:thioredoxin family protein [Planctomycetota bacterium]